MRPREWMIAAAVALAGLAMAFGITTPQSRLTQAEGDIRGLKDNVATINIAQASMTEDLKYLVLRVGEMTGKPKKR